MTGKLRDLIGFTFLLPSCSLVTEDADVLSQKRPAVPVELPKANTPKAATSTTSLQSVKAKAKRLRPKSKMKKRTKKFAASAGITKQKKRPKEP